MDQYIVKITFPAQGKTPEFTEAMTVDSKTTFVVVPYIQGEEDYSTANITVVVCAINERGETCSDEVYHQGVPRAGTGRDGGITGGGIAAIVIVLLLFFCVGIPLLILFIVLCRLYFWKNYYPVIRGTVNRVFPTEQQLLTGSLSFCREKE